MLQQPGNLKLFDHCVRDDRKSRTSRTKQPIGGNPSQKAASSMSHDNLATCVDRGWESLTQARFLVSELAFGASCRAPAATLGQGLPELAAGFDRCEQPSAARLVSGLAEAFTELGRSNLMPSESVLDVIQSAVQEFGNLLVELDATGQSASCETSRTTVRLEAEAARHKSLNEAGAATVSPLPRDKPPLGSESFANDSAMRDVLKCGERIFLASESLLKRLQTDDATPYMAPVSRIHHLAESLRGQLIQIVGQIHVEQADDEQQTADQPLAEQTVEQADQRDAPIKTEADITELFPLTLDRLSFAASTERLTASGFQHAAIPFLQRQPQVVVIDESPFFRMLLSSAIQGAGHHARASDRFGVDEALLFSEATATDFTAEDIIVWSGIEAPERTARLLEWAQTREVDSTPTLIRLLDGPLHLNGPHDKECPPAAFHCTLLRSQISELLRVISDKLGHPACAVKQSA